MISMESKDEENRVLAELGLTITQAKAYLTLCRLGASTPKKISKESKIARQDTYRILVDLQEMGLTEKALGTPILFSPIPLQDAVDLLMEQRARKSRELQVETQKLLQNYRKSSCVVNFSEDEAKFVLIPKGKACLLRGKKAIISAKESIDCITIYNRFLNMALAVGEEITAALNRGVNCRFILNSPEDKKSLMKICGKLFRKGSCAIRYLADLPKAPLVRIDDKEVLIATSPNGNFLQSPMLWSNDPSLLSITGDHFETLWNKAIEDPVVNIKKILLNA